MQNRNVTGRILVFLSTVIVSIAVASSVVSAPSSGRTSANFLQIGVGADAAGMGGAYSSVAQGASAAFWNPARIVNNGASEISFTHFMWYQGIKLNHGAAAIMLSPTTALGATITYVDYGAIEGYDDLGNSIGQINTYDMQGGLSLSLSLNEKVTVGVTGKYVGERLADITASTFAADLGVSYQETRWSASMAVVNLSKGITFQNVNEKLPSAVRVAIAATPFSRNILSSLELEKRLYGDVVLRNGMQFCFSEQYYLRGGFSYFPQNDERKLGTGFSVGAGARFGRLGVDYAFTPSDSYISDNLHRFTLVMAFGN